MKNNDIVYTIASGEEIHFQWDTLKEELNLRKHGVSFLQAISIWSDPLADEFSDLSVIEEPRFIRRGFDLNQQLLLVVYTERVSGNVLRIISARLATLRERRSHEERI